MTKSEERGQSCLFIWLLWNRRRWHVHRRHTCNMYTHHQYLRLLLAQLRDHSGTSFTRAPVLHSAPLTNYTKVMQVKGGYNMPHIKTFIGFRLAPSLRPCSFPKLLMVVRKTGACLFTSLPAWMWYSILITGQYLFWQILLESLKPITRNRR